MKTTTMILTLCVLTLFFGCEELNDATTFDTTFSIPQTITVSEQAAAKTKSAESAGAVYAFNQSKELDLADNQEVKDYLKNLKSIQISSPSVTISNLQEGQSILTFSVKIDGTEVYSVSNINASATFVPDISTQELDYIANQLKTNKKITVNVSGTTNTPSMTFNVNHKFTATIQAKLL